MKYIAGLLYLFMKGLVLTCYRIFYKDISVVNKERLTFENPGIVVSNHPSTLNDPLNVGAKMPRRISFLANAGLFNNKRVAAFLNLYCIPVERPKYVDGRRINNADSFARADEHLAKSGLIYIAPEGTSVVERRIRKIKTGSARIALSAASKKDFKLGVVILPVGLTYVNPLDFQAEVLLNVGAPIQVADYEKLYKEDSFKAAKKLTAELQKQMEELVLHTENDEQDQLLSQIQTLLQTDNWQKPIPHFHRSKSILSQILNLDNKAFRQLQDKAKSYFDLLYSTDLNDKFFDRALQDKSGFFKGLTILIGWPFFLYGWINNLLPFGIPGWLGNNLKLYPGYKPAAKTLGGLIFVPLFYWIQTKLVSHFVDIPYIGWIYLLSLLPMGWLAWQYRQIFLDYLKGAKAKQLKKQEPKVFEKLAESRKAFQNTLHELIEIT